jgi:hypothetical protein
MATNIKQRLSAFVDGMSPRARQWATVGTIFGTIAANAGDEVLVELTPYDLTKGRITYRFK